MGSHPQSDGTRYLTARRLFRALLGVTLFGLIQTSFVCLLKLSHNDFARWHELQQTPELGWLPLPDLSQWVPFLSELSDRWYTLRGPGSSEFYLRYAGFNAVVLLALVVKRRRVMGWLAQLEDWLGTSSHRRARLTVFWLGAFLSASWLMHIHTGFWWPGISGWDQRHARSRLLEQPTHPPGEDLPEWLNAALAPAHARYLPKEGYLTGPAMFLHFEDGQALPGNYGLLEVVFPNVAYGGLHREVRHPQVFLNTVRASLNNRRAGRAFFLPLALAYPNHTPYLDIDYSDYPPAPSLTHVTFWRLTAHVTEQRTLRLHSATQVGGVGADGD